MFITEPLTEKETEGGSRQEKSFQADNVNIFKMLYPNPGRGNRPRKARLAPDDTNRWPNWEELAVSLLTSGALPLEEPS